MQYIKNITEELAVGAESWERSNAWGHEAKAFWCGREVAKARIRYYNRTWERYQFESVLLSLVDKLDNEKFVPLKDRFELYKQIKEASWRFFY